MLAGFCQNLAENDELQKTSIISFGTLKKNRFNIYTVDFFSARAGPVVIPIQHVKNSTPVKKKHQKHLGSILSQ